MSMTIIVLLFASSQVEWIVSIPLCPPPCILIGRDVTTLEAVDSIWSGEPEEPVLLECSETDCGIVTGMAHPDTA